MEFALHVNKNSTIVLQAARESARIQQNPFLVIDTFFSLDSARLTVALSLIS